MTQDSATLPARTARPATGRPEPKAGILDITPYKPGKSSVEGVAHPVKLSSNENILGASPKAREAFVAAGDRLAVYPDGRANALRAAVAAHFGLEPERLAFGDGTDEVLHLLNQVFLEPGDNIVMGQYGFSAYSIGARACQGQVRHAAEPNYRLEVGEVMKLVDDRTRIVFATQPGNPTGTYLSKGDLAALHAALPPEVVLVLDEAYAEFADAEDFASGLELARASQNVVVTRTFSKIHGLASLRVGWAYCPEHIADALDRIRAPFNTSICGQEAAIAALADTGFQERSARLVQEGRKLLADSLRQKGLEVVPSQANFVLVGFPSTAGKTAAEAEAYLAKNGYIVRGVANYGLPDHLRITIGLPEHTRAVVELLGLFMEA
ncbi:histidinol-phosphate transaminase [Phenylobacterium soli]|uniref:Histidinol-phosphate aminotransferase n=1 Tax=Phenylobacterium soli TaxID=2170551 RepID=A0A328ALW3_9CAUL|nr:histidinol-phosphate transaminase [Phenylobacterium soli]RAK54414.1 histidinol-phosphate transaminase [Phenylobacterium soli]